jgi:hypothetical protein
MKMECCEMIKRIFGALSGVVVTELCMHIDDAFAMSLRATTMGGRIGAVLIGVVILLLLMILIRRFFAPAFFNGFTAAVGLFLSFDIVVFHWIFQLHRLTNGPEANWLEPIFVVFGSAAVYYGVRREKESSNGRSSKFSA